MRLSKPGEGGYLFLLVALSTMLITHPLVVDFSGVDWLLPLLVSLVLLSACWTVVSHRYQVIIIGLLILVLLADSYTRVIMSPWLSRALDAGISVVVYIWIAMILAADVFTRREAVTTDVLIGGINVYLLVGLGFGAAHEALSLMMPAAYSGLDASTTGYDAIYFSFVTLTTLGYGDVTPVSMGAKMLSFLEGVVGQLYLAVFLARLVAMQLATLMQAESSAQTSKQ